MDPEKVKVLRDQPTPTDVHGLQRFLGLANYFRKFIPHYSTIAAPLTDLTSAAKGKFYPWHAWRPPELQAFEKLKAALTGPDVMLHLPALDEPFSIHADASDLGTDAGGATYRLYQS